MHLGRHLPRGEVAISSDALCLCRQIEGAVAESDQLVQPGRIAEHERPSEVGTRRRRRSGCFNALCHLGACSRRSTDVPEGDCQLALSSQLRILRDQQRAVADCLLADLKGSDCLAEAAFEEPLCTKDPNGQGVVTSITLLRERHTVGGKDRPPCGGRHE